MSCWYRYPGLGGDPHLVELDQSRARQSRARQTHLEGLGIPVLDLLYARHVVQAQRQLVEVLYAVGESYRELLCGDARVRGGSVAAIISSVCGVLGAPARNSDARRRVP